MKTKKIKQTEKNKFKIENGLFFKEDFNKLPEGTIIYIKSGLLIPTKEKEEVKEKVKRRKRRKKRSYFRDKVEARKDKGKKRRKKMEAIY